MLVNMRFNPFRVLRRGGGTKITSLNNNIEPDEFREKLNRSLTALSTHVHRLEHKYRELEARGREYFDKCVDALVMGDEAHAKLYADEIAELRRLAKIILNSKLILEQVKIRLESLTELSEVIGLATTLKGIIGRVVGEVGKIAPEAAMSLEDLSKQIDDFMATSSPEIRESPIATPELSDEASKIFEDAKRIVAMKLRESFPEVPILTDIERLVYTYISAMSPDKEFDIKECSLALGITEDQVEEAIQGLQEKGMIEIAQAEAS